MNNFPFKSWARLVLVRVVVVALIYLDSKFLFEFNMILRISPWIEQLKKGGGGGGGVGRELLSKILSQENEAAKRNWTYTILFVTGCT